MAATSFSALLVLCSLVLATAATAAETSAREGASKAGESTFEAMDKNRDGKLSMEEAQVNADLGKLFKGLDSNKDGALSREEFAAYDPAGASKNL